MEIWGRTPNFPGPFHSGQQTSHSSQRKGETPLNSSWPTDKKRCCDDDEVQTKQRGQRYFVASSES